MHDPQFNNLSQVFLSHMLKNQRSIRNYIFSIHPHAQDLDDLIQLTALTLWREFERYDASREFLPWALRISYFEVLRLRKKQSRDRLVFSDDFIEEVAMEFADEPAASPHRQALEFCLAKLDARSREVLLARYSTNVTVKGLAAKFHVSTHKLYRMLDSARASLVTCVRRQIHLAGDMPSS